MKHSDIQNWINEYVAVWRSPDLDRLKKLFTKNISYRVSPWKEPIQGLDNLKPFWENARSGYDEIFILKSEIVAVEDKTAVARIEVMYEKGEPTKWRDLWILKFNDNGLCYSFEEWPFSPTQDDGHKDDVS